MKTILAPEPITAESGRLKPVEDKLKELADELVINYCAVSFSDKDKPSIFFSDLINEGANHRVAEFDPKTPVPSGATADKLGRRNILVIGGGATYDLYNCIPLGKGIIAELYRLNPKIDPEIVKRRFNYSRRELGMTEGEPIFENTLSLFTQWHMTPNELREKISELVDFRYPPNLFYEIIAHLFKHSFIDVIINFNFDELLDNVLDEELGKENYFNILSDGDSIPLNEIMVDGRLKIPVYIKPHGTFKHKNSLRFTNGHYLEMPESIRRLIEDLVGGSTTEESKKKGECKLPVNLMVVGFNMESIEFNEILETKMPVGSKIYHFFKEEEGEKELYIKYKLPTFFTNASEDEKKANRLITDEQLHPQIYKRIAINALGKGWDDNLTTPLGEMFSFIWRKIFHQLKPGFMPRSIGQHEITSYLFYNRRFNKKTKAEKELDESDLAESKLAELNSIVSKEKKVVRKNLIKAYDENYKYFLDRTLVEIAIAINRNNGVVELAQLMSERVGKYFALYKAAFNKTHKYSYKCQSIYKLIDQFKGENERADKNKDFYPQGIFELNTACLLEANGLLDNAKEIYGRIKDKPALAGEIRCLKPWIQQGANDRFVKALVKKFVHIGSREKDNKDPKKNNLVTPVVLYRLFTSKLLSDGFRRNFMINYNKNVYNGKEYDPDTLRRMRLTAEIKPNGVKMIDELERLFDKSDLGSIAYFTIHPDYSNPKNFLIESFSKSTVLHTNLALAYKLRELFLGGRERKSDWDEMLVISERTCMFEFLKKDDVPKDFFKGKKITIINSYEAIKQTHSMYSNEFDKKNAPLMEEKRLSATDEEYWTFEDQQMKKKIKDLNKLQEDSYNEVLKKMEYDYDEGCINASCLPAMQHNYHMVVFIKKGPDTTGNLPSYMSRSAKGLPALQLNLVGAIYMYRPGFSAIINPVYIGAKTGDSAIDLDRDFKRLLSIFSKTYSRAESFKLSPHSRDFDIDFKGNLFKILKPGNNR